LQFLVSRVCITVPPPVTTATTPRKSKILLAAKDSRIVAAMRERGQEARFRHTRAMSLSGSTDSGSDLGTRGKAFCQRGT
jgi:hypothetical protein